MLEKNTVSRIRIAAQFDVSKQKYCPACKKKHSIKQFKTIESKYCIYSLRKH